MFVEMSGITSKPWLRTLSDEKAEAAARMILCALRLIPGQMKEVDFAEEIDFLLVLDDDASRYGEVRIVWDRGYLRLLQTARRAFACHVNDQSDLYTTIEIEDTPSACNSKSPITSVQDVTNRIKYWLEGINSPFFSEKPPGYRAEISRFLDKIAIAATISEPEWCSLYVEPYRETLTDVVCLIFKSYSIDLGVGDGYPDTELHPILAGDLRAIMSRYTEVRENDFHGRHDLRIHIGDTAMMIVDAPDTVQLLRLCERCRDHVPLYGNLSE